MWRIVTVERAASRMSLRTLAFTSISRMSFGSNGRVDVPVGPTISRTSCGWYSWPPFASAA